MKKMGKGDETGKQDQALSLTVGKGKCKMSPFEPVAPRANPGAPCCLKFFKTLTKEMEVRQAGEPG